MRRLRWLPAVALVAVLGAAVALAAAPGSFTDSEVNHQVFSAAVTTTTTTLPTTTTTAPTTTTTVPPGSRTFGPGTHSFVVPAGKTSVTATVQGAAGGAQSGSGGQGAVLPATAIPVTPGETLTIYVGSAGTN
jgi:hypothetical protein